LYTALRVIREEHHRLSAVIQGMLYFVRTIDKGGQVPDLKVFRAMLLYISDYPEKVHHPKEDHYLFAQLRKRTHEADAVLDELEAQHGKGDALVRALEHALTRYELLGRTAFPEFLALVESYAQFYFAHMRLEEEAIMPAAQRALTPEDWASVDAAFDANRDPLAGGEYKEGLDRLFSLIANITPAPIGLGPENR
jgi:hemerythrin-like domain-containing protein